MIVGLRLAVFAYCFISGETLASPRILLSHVHKIPLTIIGQTRTVMMTAAVYESLGIYKGLWHTLRHGPIVDLVPKRS